MAKTHTGTADVEEKLAALTKQYRTELAEVHKKHQAEVNALFVKIEDAKIAKIKADLKVARHHDAA